MYSSEQQKKNYKCRVIKVFHAYRSGGDIYELRVVAWSEEGKENPPTLEHRQFYLDYKGDEALGRIKGLTAEDMYRIIQHLPEISRLMKFPLPINDLKKAISADLPQSELFGSDAKEEKKQDPSPEPPPIFNKPNSDPDTDGGDNDQ